MAAQLAILVEQLFNALSLAGIYVLVAMGLTLVFGLTRIINFAQGEFVTLGAFVTLSLVDLRVPVPAAMLAAGVGVGLLSEVLDIGVFRRTLTRPINGFIVSLGLIVALEALYALRWPGALYSIPPVLDGIWRLGPIHVAQERVVLILVAASACAVLFWFLERTHYGRGIRALAEDRTSAQVLGVRVSRLISVTFIIGSGLAGLAGGLLGTIFPFTAFFGSAFLLKGFAVAIVGGLGNIRGVIVAAVILALAEVMGGAYISLAWSPAILLVVMVAIILWRPHGLFRGSETAESGDPLRGEHLLGAGAGLAAARGWAGRALQQGPRAAVVGAAMALATVPLWIDSYHSLSLLTFALVNAIAVYSMWFAFRYAGIFSVAQASFVGIGAYATVILTIHFSLNFWEQLAASVVLGGVLAAVFGLVALRASGTYLLILLFALSQLEVIVVENWSPLTGGIFGISLPSPPSPFGPAVNFNDPIALYYLVLAATAVAVVALWLLGRSRFGDLLASLRDNEPLAQSLGLNTFLYKLTALAVSGGVAGLGGALLVFVAVGIAPTYFDVNASIQYSLMMILGGSGTLVGPLIGSIVATFLPDVVHLQPYQAQFVYGVLLVLMIIVLPTGVIGALRSWYFVLAERIATRRA